jgi:hypothetical protein
MEISEIWATVIIPLIVGPLFIFFKSLWDRTHEAKLLLRKNQYEEEVTQLKEELTLFYYPLYLNLLNLYGLCFSIPEKNTENVEDFSSSDSELSDGNEQGEKHYKKRRCKAYYKVNEIIETCRNVIPHNFSSKMCKTCRWKMVQGDIEMGLLHTNEENEENEENLNNIESYSTKKKRLTKRNRLRRSTKFSLQEIETNNEPINEQNINEEIRITIPTLNEKKSESSFENEEGVLIHESTLFNVDLEPLDTTSLDLQLNLAEQFKHLSISLSPECIFALQKTTEPYYETISNIIENNIHRVEPETRLMTHLIRFMKYSKIKKIFFEHQLDKEENSCKPENLGVEDNIVKLLTHIEACIKAKGKKLRQIIREGYIVK